MLSAQLSAMELNVLNGFVDANSLVYASDLLAFERTYGDYINGGTNGQYNTSDTNIEQLNASGFITVKDLMTRSNNALRWDPTTSAGPTLDDIVRRLYEGSLKNALDLANNNVTFVQLI
jgi:hypothetical protein